ncbi:MAG TPA: hypothetical protein VGM10_15255 [Actinocrinis sp.]|jgi:hypothetical protein
MTDASLPKARRAPVAPVPAAAAARGRDVAAAPARDPHRVLQLALAALWLLDGVLQFQPYMFTKDFAAQTLAGAAAGNPGWLAGTVTWGAGLVQNHPVGADTAFGLVQVALGLGIAWRPTLKPALAASVAWAVGVWWFGEGFGGLLTGGANPLTGAPGAAVLYALAAVLLWPAARDAGPFPAARRIGARAARTAWSVLWALLAYLAVQPANTAPDAAHDAITDTEMGAPRWLVALDDRAASLTAGRGLAVALVLAVLCALIAVSVWLPGPRAVRAGLAAAVVLAALCWVFWQGFGMPYQGMATDPNAAPLLALLAAAYWPYRVPPGQDAAESAAARGEAPAGEAKTGEAA